MTALIDQPLDLFFAVYTAIRGAPPAVILSGFFGLVFLGVFLIYLALHLFAPTPRPPLPSEKLYITTNADGTISSPRPLPCWHDTWVKKRRELMRKGDDSDEGMSYIDDAEIAMSVVVPAYNEEERMQEMLEEAVAFLDAEYGRSAQGAANGNVTSIDVNATPSRSSRRKKRGNRKGIDGLAGYEIILVNDGSKDRTVEVALEFSRKHGLHDILRIVTLQKNRGKGGAVTHGFRHVRGLYTVFADADGASKFDDLAKLVDGCRMVEDSPKRGVAVGSRAHLVGSEAVVKRSALRNALMRGFHMVLMILTPPATSRIRDTQCGFKLFSRSALPHIIPYMHAEGWIFDVEMLMLAESAPPGEVYDEDGLPVGTSPGIKVAEVPIHWHEVGGSKLNVMRDSLAMAWGLAVLRASWMFGVYRRRLV